MSGQLTPGEFMEVVTNPGRLELGEDRILLIEFAECDPQKDFRATTARIIGTVFEKDPRRTVVGCDPLEDINAAIAIPPEVRLREWPLVLIEWRPHVAAGREPVRISMRIWVPELDTALEIGKDKGA